MEITFQEQVRRKILLIALFITAFSSLVYELVWSRELSYIFGSTAISASSVLAVFMGGLAFGSLYAGKILESCRRPYRLLCYLQFAIGLSCILTLFVIKWVYGYQSYLFDLVSADATFGVKVVLFLVTSFVLIVPTFLIGVAFPCIVQLFHANQESVGQSVSRCYWIDTLGASAGMLLAAFFIVPSIGFFRTSLAASALNLFAGILIFVFLGKADRDYETPASKVCEPEEASRSLDIKVISFLFFLSGFSALVLEVLWIRHVGMLFGSGLQAFALVVVTFLLGLSLGSLVYDLRLKGIRNQVFLFSVIELLIGTTSVVITAIFPHLEGTFLRIYYGINSYPLFVFVLGLLFFIVLLIPTTLMGMTLPALCAINVSGRHVGKGVGRLYAFNSFGALAGSFCAGFIIIPALGMIRSSFVASGIYIFIAFAFLFCFSESGFKLRKVVTAFILILIATGVVFSQLNIPNHLYNGVFYTATIYEKEDSARFFRRQKMAARLLRFLEDGVYGQVSVVGSGSNLMLRTHCRMDSGTTADLVSYQSLLGHLPMIFHDNPKHILNIGLGCGWTVLATTRHPLLESIDCVEINPLVIEVNRNVFHSFNDDVLNKSKVNMIINDGRNYVASTKKKYDVVISEPTDLSSSGISALFTKEFYGHVQKALNDDGMLCQWFPRYELAERDYKIILNTIKSVFGYAYEFDMSKVTGDEFNKSYLIMAFKNPVDIKKLIADRRSTNRPGQPAAYHTYVKSLLDTAERSFNKDNEGLEAYIADVDHINTDDLPLVELHAARDRFRKFRKE